MADLKEFRCENCGKLLCLTNGNFFKAEIQGNMATVYTEKFDFPCECGASRLWKQKSVDKKRKTVKNEVEN